MRLTLEPEIKDDELKNVIQKEKVTFRDLSGKKKLEYIWDYYKWKIIGLIAVIVVVATVVPTIIENNKEVALYAAFVNTQLSDQDEPELMDEFIKAKQIDIKNKRTVMDCSMMINYSTPDQMSMMSSQKLLAMFGAKRLDVVLQDTKTYTQYAAMDAYGDLEQILDEAHLEKYRDLLVYTDGKGDAGRHAYGIDVSESPVLVREKAYIVPAVFSICVSTQQTDNAIRFLEYLMGD